MKIYDPIEKDSFIMQFGFRSPDWTAKTVYNYIKKADRKPNTKYTYVKKADRNNE
jgi:hypothetical protein